jgi:putative transposase
MELKKVPMQRIEINLKSKEQKFLRSFLKTGRRSKREYDRANILLALHKGKSDSEIAEFLEVERTTIWRLRKKYLEQGIDLALAEEARTGQPKKYEVRQEAEVAALACSDPPKGRIRWTLGLLTKRLRLQSGFATVNRESIRLILKKTNVSLG